MTNEMERWLEASRKFGLTNEQLADKLRSQKYTEEDIANLLNKNNQETMPDSQTTNKFYLIPSWIKPNKKNDKIPKNTLASIFSSKPSLYYVWAVMLMLVLISIARNILSLFESGLPAEDIIIGVVAIVFQCTIFFFLYRIHHIGDRLLIVVTALSLIGISSVGYFNFLMMLALFMLNRYVLLGVDKLATNQNFQNESTTNNEPKWSHLRILLIIIVVMIIGGVFFLYLLYQGYLSCFGTC